MIKTLLQKRADEIIDRMQQLADKTDDAANAEFNALYNMGMQLDMLATYFFNVELD